jgi:hypothetical protein
MPSGSKLIKHPHRYVKEEHGNTVLCPHCQADTVLCDARVQWSEADILRWHHQLFPRSSTPRKDNLTPRKTDSPRPVPKLALPETTSSPRRSRNGRITQSTSGK